MYANWLNGGVRGLTESVFSNAGLESASTSYAGTRAEPSLRDEPVRSGRNIGVGNSNQNFMLKKKLPSGIRLFFPDLSLAGDNGAMVAAACYFEIQSGVEPVDPYLVNIYPRISIES